MCIKQRDAEFLCEKSSANLFWMDGGEKGEVRCEVTSPDLLLIAFTWETDSQWESSTCDWVPALLSDFRRRRWWRRRWWRGGISPRSGQRIYARGSDQGNASVRQSCVSVANVETITCKCFIPLHFGWTGGQRWVFSPTPHSAWPL